MKEKFLIYKIGFGYTGETFKDEKAADNYCKNLNVNECRYVYKRVEIESVSDVAKDNTSVNVKMIKAYINKIKKGHHSIKLFNGQIIGGYTYKDLEKIVQSGKEKFKTFGYWNSDGAYITITANEYQSFLNKYNDLTEEIQGFEQDMQEISAKNVDSL